MIKINKIKENKVINYIISTIRILVFVLLFGFIIVVCLQRFSDNKISFFNFRMFTVISGSMEPKYMIGDVLISKEVSPSTIRVGDTISYLGDKGGFNNKVITHQVVDIEQDEEGSYLFHTKGLANLVQDPVVSETQVYGKVIYKSVILSLVYKIVSTSIGFYLFIIVPLLFIIISEIVMTMVDKEEERRAKLKDNT